MIMSMGTGPTDLDYLLGKARREAMQDLDKKSVLPGSAADLLARQIEYAHLVANGILLKKFPDEARVWARMELAEKLRYLREHLDLPLKDPYFFASKPDGGENCVLVETKECGDSEQWLPKDVQTREQVIKHLKSEAERWTAIYRAATSPNAIYEI